MNGKQCYMMTSGFQQYIVEYTDTNFSHYPIRRRVAYTSALECIIDCGFLLESPHQGGSNEHPQAYVYGKNKEILLIIF